MIKEAYDAGVEDALEKVGIDVGHYYDLLHQGLLHAKPMLHQAVHAAGQIPGAHAVADLARDSGHQLAGWGHEALKGAKDTGHGLLEHARNFRHAHPVTTAATAGAGLYEGAKRGTRAVADKARKLVGKDKKPSGGHLGKVALGLAGLGTAGYVVHKLTNKGEAGGGPSTGHHSGPGATYGDGNGEAYG